MGLGCPSCSHLEGSCKQQHRGRRGSRVVVLNVQGKKQLKGQESISTAQLQHGPIKTTRVGVGRDSMAEIISPCILGVRPALRSARELIEPETLKNVDLEAREGQCG
jgi:hypothetical protein